MTSHRFSMLARLAAIGLVVLPGVPHAVIPANPPAPRPVIKPSPPPKPVIKPSPPPKPALLGTQKTSTANKSAGPGAKAPNSSKGKAGTAPNTVPPKPQAADSSGGTQPPSGSTPVPSSGDAAYRAGK